MSFLEQFVKTIIICSFQLRAHLNWNASHIHFVCIPERENIGNSRATPSPLDEDGQMSVEGMEG